MCDRRAPRDASPRSTSGAAPRASTRPYRLTASGTPVCWRQVFCPARRLSMCRSVSNRRRMCRRYHSITGTGSTCAPLLRRLWPREGRRLQEEEGGEEEEGEEQGKEEQEGVEEREKGGSQIRLCCHWSRFTPPQAIDSSVPVQYLLNVYFGGGGGWPERLRRENKGLPASCKSALSG